jgi:hypothetical protein
MDLYTCTRAADNANLPKPLDIEAMELGSKAWVDKLDAQP